MAYRETNRHPPSRLYGDIGEIGRFHLRRKKPSIITLADRARDAGEWELAAQLYRKALDRNPRNPPICIQYGHALKESGKLVQAESAYRAALDFEPGNPDAHLQLGHVLKLQGKVKEAQAAYLRAFVLEPLIPYPVQELREIGWPVAKLMELRSLLANGSPWASSPGMAGNLQFPPAMAQADEAAQSGTEASRSGTFDAEWYIKQYPDVARAGVDPLEHFRKHGLKEGRKPNAAEARAGGSDIIDFAEIYCLKPLSFRDEMALFVTHSPNGRLKPHVRHYLDSIKRQSIAVILIVAPDRPFTDTDNDLVSGIDGLFVRRNAGYDFAAWAHILHLHPELFDTKILYLLNDSLIGPTNDVAFGNILDRMRNSPADLIGLTDNFERGWHISSYFLAFKQRALSSAAFHHFINDIASYQDKEDVINQFEIRLAPTLKAAGLNCEALFPARDFSSPTVYDWKHLLQAGFPFLKVMTIRGAVAGVDISGWRAALVAQGYDVSLADRTLAEARAPSLPAQPLVRTTRQLLLPPGLAPVGSAEIKVAFIGPWNYNNGLGVASQSYVSALRHTGLTLNLHPIRMPFHIHQPVAPAVDICDFSGASEVAIAHLNPDSWAALLTQAQRAIIERARVRVGLWVWEMARIPAEWDWVFDEVDAIWAPSRYCADIFAAKARVPVDVIPHVVSVGPLTPNSARTIALRRALGLSEDDRIILYAFDGSSYLVRKNPFALIHAFARSRLAERGWRLVLKSKNASDSPAEGNRLQREVERTPGVVFVDRSVDRTTMKEFLRAADIYASPHCSEGFGLTIAEAMAMGKIVIATDYGGSRDFLDAHCGFPVRYTMQSLDKDHGHYTREGGAWAQVDEAHLTEALVEASDLVAAGDTRVGEAARRRIETRLSPDVVGTKMRKSISRLLYIG